MHPVPVISSNTSTTSLESTLISGDTPLCRRSHSGDTKYKFERIVHIDV